MRRLARVAPWIALVLTVISALLLPRLRLSGSLSRLFPDDPAAVALGRYVDAFGGGDVTILLVQADDPARAEAAAEALAKAVVGRPGIRTAVTHVRPPRAEGEAPDPTLLFAFADDAEQKELAQILGEGMKGRLEDTRAMLLMPGSGEVAELVKHDPLRLLQGARARARSIAATASTDESGALAADGGKARFVLVSTQGSALDSAEARRVVDSLEAAIAEVSPGHPGVRARIAGGAAIARDVERMIRRDLYLSSAISTVLVALAFVLTFRRTRALLAIGPPLLIGTLWTTAVAALLPGGITAIAMGFASVVIGVGLDTGVHVYAAVERARREQPDASDEEIAPEATRAVWRPTLTAAVAAGCAFGALALSRLSALRELGLLCATGEVLTALAILAMTPRLAARLERTPHPERPLTFLVRLGEAIVGRGGRVVAFGVVAIVVALIVVGPPKPGGAIVAVKPRNLPSLAAQEDAIRLTAHEKDEVQLTVIQSGPDEQAVLARAEKLAAGLAGKGGRTVESIAPWLPSEATVRARFAARDALLVGKPSALEAALVEVGFAVEPFAPAIAHLKEPAPFSTAIVAVARLRQGPLAPLVARHVARHPKTGETLVATYVRGPKLDAAALATEVAALDRDAVVTGYPVLEGSLRAALTRDLPRVSLVALVLVILALRSVLRSAREVLVALIALLVELAIVALLVRAFGVSVHVYDALVLPVLLGITVDESMFLLHAMREGDARTALHREGRAIVTTACTTAAGFVALLGCGFPGLRDLGAVGVIGTLAGLTASLVVVPAVAGLLTTTRHVPKDAALSPE